MASANYTRFSAYGFARSDYLEAAKRFLELREEVVRAEELCDEEHRHEDFVSCDLCEDASELRRKYDALGQHFAYVWALKLLESQP
jgi:hypothetical protein